MSVIQGGIRDEYVRVNLCIVDGPETVFIQEVTLRPEGL